MNEQTTVASEKNEVGRVALFTRLPSIWRLKVAMWQALGSGEVRMIDRREDEECVRVGEDTTR